jgi:hypothetical protein
MGERRWWEDLFIVVEIDGMLIGFNGAKTTGDESPYEKGWEFDINTVGEVEKIEKLVKQVEYYLKPIKEEKK